MRFVRGADILENPVVCMRQAIQLVATQLEQDSIFLLPASRGLQAIVDKQFEAQVSEHRWYAIVSRGDHIHVVADIGGRRVSLQRYILILANPLLTFDDVTQVSFANKISLDCRLANLTDRIGRQAVMRNRRPKRNTTSKFKGVSKAQMPNGTTRWKAQIKGESDHIYLGYFDDEVMAAMVYDAAAYLLFDGAALYNLPELTPNLDAMEIAVQKIAKLMHRKKEQTAP
jgi:hypothetical protein